MPNGVVVTQHTEAQIQGGIARLTAAGLTAEAAERVARHPGWGPVVLGPGVIVSLFPLREADQPVEVAS